LSEQSKKVKEKISSSDFEKQLTDLLMNHVVTEKLVEEKTKEEKVKVEKWADENDDEIDKMGDEILEKYKKLEETNSQPVDSGDN
jgi:septin family protein